MLRKIGEWFWRGDALKAARSIKDETGRKEAAIASDLVGAATALGSAEGTLLAHGLLLTAAVIHASRALGLEPAADDKLLDDEKLRERLTALGFSKPRIDEARAALVPEGGGAVPEAAGVSALQRIANALVNDAVRRTLSAGNLLVQRGFRLFLVAAALVGFVTVMWISPWWLRDKARGATWEASSAFGEPGNTISGTLGWPPGDYFFHTNEEDHPWVIIDLGSEKSFSKIRVVNRIAGSRQRSNPLLVEVSNDRQNWEKVAQRDEYFDVWVTDFPTKKARYLRLSLLQRNFFHLNAVQVL